MDGMPDCELPVVMLSQLKFWAIFPIMDKYEI